MVTSGPVIREVSTANDIRSSTRVVRDSFYTVAAHYHLTRQNCPTHPTFMSGLRLKEIKESGLSFFGLFLNEKQIGFIAVEPEGDGCYCLDELAVLPEYRHAGYGRKLMQYGLDNVRKKKGRKVTICIMKEDSVLKQWYLEMGFKETHTRNYVHLPFTVSYLEYYLE